MILAAGRGHRLRPLTDSCPKPLLKLGSMRLIEHLLLALRRAGVETVVMNVSWLASMIIEVLGDGRRYGLTIVYSIEEGRALETAGGIAKALPLLGDDVFWVVNADVFTDFTFSWSADTLAANDQARLLLAHNPPQNSAGDFVCKDGRLGRANARSNTYTYCGIGLFRPEFFANVPVEPTALAPLLFDAADSGNLAGEVFSGCWDDIGTEDRLAARRLMLDTA